MRRAWRWFVRLGLGACALALVGVAVALVAVHTDWGREQLRARIESKLRDAFPGSRVGAVEGSVLGTLTLRDIELAGGDGRRIAKVATLRTAVALWPLANRTVRVDRLIADDVQVMVRPQPAAAGPPVASQASAWRIELPSVAVHRAAVEIDAGGVRATLADVDFAGAATAEHGGAALFGWTHARWTERGSELTGAAAIVLDGGVRVPGALVRLGDATLAAAGLALDADHPRGSIAVVAPAGALAALAPELGVAQLGDLIATIDATAATSSTRLEVNARLGDARLWASLAGEPAARTARGVVSIAGLDLAAVTGGRRCGRGDVLAAIEGSADRVRATLVAGGNLLAALGIDPAAGCTAPSDQRAVVGVDATRSEVRALVLGGGAGVQALAIADGKRDPAGVLELGVHAAAAANAVLAGGRTITARVAVDATATGTLSPARDVRIAGTLAGREVTVDDIALASVGGAFDVRVTDAGALGKASLLGTRVRSGTTAIGTVRAEIANHRDGTLRVAATAALPQRVEIFVDARIAPADSRGVVDRSRITLPNGMVWAGQTGALALSDARASLRNAVLRNGDASVALRGDFLRATSALAVHADVDRFAVSAFDPRYRGVASGTLELGRRRGQWSADGRFAIAGLALGDGEALDATAHAVLEGRRATLDAHATSPALGEVGLAFEAAAPRDPFDLRAWQALDRGAVRNATVTAQKVALAGVAGVVGRASPDAPTGTIDGSVNLAPAALDGELAVRGAALASTPLDGDVSFAPEAGDLVVHASARASGIASEATVRFAVPQRPFDPASWRYRGRDLWRAARAEIPDLEFSPEMLDKLGASKLLAGHGVELPYRGHASVTLELGGAARDARLAIDLNDVTGGALLAPVSQHVAVTAGDTGTHLRAEMFGAGGERAFELGTLDADVAMTPDRWLDDPRAVLGLPITGSWTLPRTALPPLLAIVGRRDLTAGTIEGAATIGGTIAAPAFPSLRLLARDVAVAPLPGGRTPPVLRDLEAVASWDGETAHIELTGHEADGGRLRAIATGRLDALAATTGSLVTEKLDVAPFAVLLPGVLPSLPGELASLAGVVEARLDLRDGRMLGKATLTGGALPVAATIGTLRDAAAEITLDERAITAELTARLGAGKLHLTADAPTDLAAIHARLGLEQVSPLTAMRPIINADLKAELHLGGARRCGSALLERARLCGEVTVERALVAVPEHAGPPLLDPAAPSDLIFVGAAARAPEAPLPARPLLAFELAFTGTRVEAPSVAEGIGLQATLGGDRLVVSIGPTVEVLGRVELDNAYVDFLGRRYQLDASDVTFDGTIDPLLAIHMTHAFPELTLGVDLRGRASKWERPQFSSDPGGYSQDQLFGFFLGGEPGGDPGSQTREAFAGAAARLVSGRLGRQIGKVLPIQLDTVSCEPATTASAATGGSCTFGKWLSQRLFVAYRQHLGGAPDENTGDVQVQVRMGRRVVIEGTGGDRGHYGADLLWRRRW